MILRNLKKVLLLGLCAGCSSVPQAPKNPWAEVTTGANGQAESIGSYDRGCVLGAQSLPPDGEGFHVMRISRRRFYGHPDLIRFLTTLGKQVRKAKLADILIGDLGQPRGGPAPYGHRSHQSGLDVDIWFLRPDSPQVLLTLDERENLSAKSVIAEPRFWTSREGRVLKLAASVPEVERIFVDPWIKKQLCEKNRKPSDEAWLRKLRPWRNHDDHFHVRLRCPDSSVNCKHQEAVPDGSGCDETLEWWFSEEARREAEELAKAPPSKPELPELPPECAPVLTAQ